MNHENNTYRVDLQLFGDGQGASGDNAVLTGVTATDAASPSGVTARDAAVQDRAAAFEALIKGEYKDLYDARVQDTVRRRLGAAKEEGARYRAVEPTLALIGELLGEEPSEAEAIGKKLRALLKEDAKKREASARDTQKDRERCENRYRQWAGEARALTGRYPHFDVGRELRDPRFRAKLQGGVDMRTAFESVHRDEILHAAMSHTARAVREQLSRTVGLSALRPAENGITPRATAGHTSDVSQLSRAERDAIIRRVREGEKITV